MDAQNFLDSALGMRVGIQGEMGSACDEVASAVLGSDYGKCVLDYLTTAERTLTALVSAEVQLALLALESPVGIPVEETQSALLRFPAFEIVRVVDLHVEQHLLSLPGKLNEEIRAVASHPVALRKHAEFLSTRFPQTQRIEVADSGLAAQLLSEGQLPANTAVIAMPSAARIFGLQTLETNLPGNVDYFTRFALVRARA